jgi:phage baseplate assembly protein W
MHLFDGKESGLTYRDDVPVAPRQLGFPLQIDSTGRTITVSEAEHVSQLIEQLVLTQPGERASRPEFGCVLPSADEYPGSSDAMVEAIRQALQRWLSDDVAVEHVAVATSTPTINVAIQFVNRRDRQRQIVSFSAVDR